MPGVAVGQDTQQGPRAEGGHVGPMDNRLTGTQDLRQRSGSGLSRRIMTWADHTLSGGPGKQSVQKGERGLESAAAIGRGLCRLSGPGPGMPANGLGGGGGGAPGGPPPQKKN